MTDELGLAKASQVAFKLFTKHTSVKLSYDELFAIEKDFVDDIASALMEHGNKCVDEMLAKQEIPKIRDDAYKNGFERGAFDTRTKLMFDYARREGEAFERGRQSVLSKIPSAYSIFQHWNKIRGSYADLKKDLRPLDEWICACLEEKE